MHLWTFQGKGWDITDSKKKNDPYKGIFYQNVPDYILSLEKLCDKIQVEKFQLVWCITNCKEVQPEDWPQHKLWELDVPDSEILKTNHHKRDWILKVSFWNIIIRGSSKYLEDKWKNEALEEMGSPSRYQEIYESKQNKFYENHPTNKLWEALFLDRITKEDSNVILRFPVDQSWVVSDKDSFGRE